jgi:glycyl-tRNA synthetase
VGTPFCVTIDFETEETGTVTVRHRDSMAQERVAIKDLESFIRGMIQF